MFKIDSAELAKCVDRFCKENGIRKLVFHDESGISSATLTQWRQGGKEVKGVSVQKLEAYTGMPIDSFVARYGDSPVEVEAPEDDDTISIREFLRDRPEGKMLFHAAKDAPASALLEAAAIIMRYKEESENK